MNSRSQSFLKVAGAVAVLAIAGCFLVGQVRAFRHSGRDSANIWFYNVTTKKLYAADGDTISPDSKHGDGVRAMVVALGKDVKDPKSLKIAYLETCTPELKGMLERIKGARAAGRVFDGKIPARGSSYFETNTLVRRSEESDWHPVNTPEGQKIMTEWRSWRGPNGERPVASVP